MTSQNSTSTKQSYIPLPTISGVVRNPIKGFAGDGGDFYEITRRASEYKQLSYSTILPGVVKAFHIHKEQTDLWIVLPGCRAIVGLCDNRPDSDTYGLREKIIVGPTASFSILIPPGVAHGIANPYQELVHHIYLMDKVFNPDDEYRLPWDYAGKELWEVEKG